MIAIGAIVLGMVIAFVAIALIFYVIERLNKWLEEQDEYRR